MTSKYDPFWQNLRPKLERMLAEALSKGTAGFLDVSAVSDFGDRASWAGQVSVSSGRVLDHHGALAKSLGNVLLATPQVRDNPGSVFHVRIQEDGRLTIKVTRSMRRDAEGSSGLSTQPAGTRSVTGPDTSAVLPDVLEHDLLVVFCGAAVGDASAQKGAYYAGPGNRFWDTLHKVGLTPVEIEPARYRDVLRYGIGLTDMVKDQSGRDASLILKPSDREDLRRKIAIVKPKALAFNGKNAAEAYLGRTAQYGMQSRMDCIGPTVLFVLPSTSGAARGYWDESYWLQLAAFVGRGPKAVGR